MQFQRITPPPELTSLIECFWIASDDSTTPVIQKIIPDGFTEVIFHFGDPYAIKLRDKWELQPRQLLCGQITGHFFLQNTGRTEILGIKFKPAAITHLYKISMRELTGSVVSLESYLPDQFEFIKHLSATEYSGVARIDEIIKHFSTRIIPNLDDLPIEKAIRSIFTTQGMITVSEMSDIAGVQPRTLERLFKKYIGLSPKFYARIIRFGSIFQKIQERKMSGSELGLETGFYDQSHFIKNFKAFTGEDPSQYFFDAPNLANFFLKKR